MEIDKILKFISRTGKKYFIAISASFVFNTLDSKSTSRRKTKT